VTVQKQRWEFGTIEWVRYAAGLGVALLAESALDLGRYEWGFSEEYTHIPERLLAGRDKAGYHLMISGGKVSGGTSLPDQCLALPGFHASVDWALIAHSSYFPFNMEGRRQRAADHAALRADLKAAGVPFVWNAPRYGEFAESTTGESRPRCPVCRSPDHDRLDCRVWPPGVGEVLAENLDKTSRLRRSPELEDLPETEWAVPVFSRMTDDQKTRFIALLG
jgi:hypothetical protein